MTRKSGLADSPFFSFPATNAPTLPAAEPPSVISTPLPEKVPASTEASSLPLEDIKHTSKGKKAKVKQPRNRDVTTSRNYDVTTSLHHDATLSSSDDIVSKLRSIVKQIGKEPTTCRLTTEEKLLLKDVEYEYGKRGIATSGNEILRIAINNLIDDYKQHGEESILDKVLKALNE